MVVRIGRSGGSSIPALEYNERKVAKGVAAVIGYANLPSGNPDIVRDTFEAYEHWSRRASCLRFHASVNPSQDDSCTQEQVLEFIHGMMSSLGYSGQPYVVYVHNDIGREHYHVVSVRSDRDGNKISDWRERWTVQSLMMSEGERLGFHAGRDVLVSQSLEDEDGAAPARRPPRFSPSGSLSTQMRGIVGWTLGYCMTSEEQFRDILSDYGVRCTREAGRLVFRGTDDRGIAVTVAVCGKDLLPDLEPRLTDSIGSGRFSIGIRCRERARVDGIVSSCFRLSRSEKHLMGMLRVKGIGMHAARGDDGRMEDVTFVDHVTRTVFRASELGMALTPATMETAMREGRWPRMEMAPGRSSGRHGFPPGVASAGRKAAESAGDESGNAAEADVKASERVAADRR